MLRGNEAVIARPAATRDDVVTTWISAAELQYDAARSKAPANNQALVKRFLATLPILGLDEASAQIFGEAKALLERQGQRLADADLFIGATRRGRAWSPGTRATTSASPASRSKTGSGPEGVPDASPPPDGREQWSGQ